MTEPCWQGCGPSCCRCHCDCMAAVEARADYDKQMAAIPTVRWAEIRTEAATRAAQLEGLMER